MARERKNSRSKSSNFFSSKKPETLETIFRIFCGAAAIILVLAAYGQAGPIGSIASHYLLFIFGWGYWAAAFGLVLLSLGLPWLKPFRKAELPLAVVVFASLLGLFDFIVPAKGGGWLGNEIARFVTFGLGWWGGGVVLSAIFLASLLLIFEFSFGIFESLVFVFNAVWRVSKWFGGLFKKRAPGEFELAKNQALAKAGAEAEPGLLLSGMPKAVAEQLSRLEKKAKDSAKDVKKLLRKEGVPALMPRQHEAWRGFPLSLLDSEEGVPNAGDIERNKLIIQKTLASFGIAVEMREVNVGPTVTQFSFRPMEGIKLSRITSLERDLSLALAAHPLRIEAPIPGKSLCGIEIPNRLVRLVRLKNLLSEPVFQGSQYALPIAIGRDVNGDATLIDLTRLPHLLIAGSTGAGKSVAIHSLLLSLLQKRSPEMLSIILIDPKRVELSLYQGIPHLIAPPITEGKKALAALRWLTKEMERRYALLLGASARDINSYNVQAVKEGEVELPWIVTVIDELADLMVQFGRDLEAIVVRLAQMSRATGIHLVVSTQRPSVEVITGLIKANITSRVAFQVASQVDSRTILDQAGAEKLLGKGDMLWLAGDASKPKRLQGAYVSEDELKRVATFLRRLERETLSEELILRRQELSFEFERLEEREGVGGDKMMGFESDPLLAEAERVVVQARKASASLLQRRLRVGYARAARLLDLLEEQGIVGPGEGAKPREVLRAAPMANQPQGLDTNNNEVRRLYVREDDSIEEDESDEARFSS